MHRLPRTALLRILPGLTLAVLALQACSPRTVTKSADSDGKVSSPLPTGNYFASDKADSTPFYAEYRKNPVPWQPWSKDTLAAAAKSNRPILLHAGYSTCPFTRRLRMQLLDSPELADYLAKNFVCVLVDSEDDIALTNLLLECMPNMETVPAWPILLWLDPNGRPYRAHDFTKRSGFTAEGIKASAATALTNWNFGADFVGRVADEILQKSGAAAEAVKNPEPMVRANALELAYQTITKVYDKGYGTVSAGQNFPRPNTLQLMLSLADYFPEDSFRRGEMLEAADNCLTRMHNGAVFDPLDHTFHRYSEKPNWDAPHSEKLLSDQATIIPVYLDAANRLEKPEFREIAFSIMDEIVRTWKTPEGMYLHAKSAFVPADWTEAPPFLAPWYTWSAAHVRQLLTKDEADLVIAYHGIRERGNMPPAIYSSLFKDRSNVLTTAKPIEKVSQDLGIPLETAKSRLASAQAKMSKARAETPGAYTDTRCLLLENGLVLAALARCAQSQGGDRFRAEAVALRNTLLTRAVTPEGTLTASGWWQNQALPATPSHVDYAATLHGLLLAHALEPDQTRLALYTKLQASVTRLFPDLTTGAFQSYAPNLLLPLNRPCVSISDTSLPADNALTATNLRLLAELTGDQSYLQSRNGILNLLGNFPKQSASAHLLLAEFAKQDKLDANPR